LLKSRSPKQINPRSSYPLSGIIRCSECGRNYRRQTSRGTVYWVCSSRESGASSCKSQRLRETDVYDTYTSLMSKLSEHRNYLLGALISQFELMLKSLNNNEDRIRKIDGDIAVIASKNLVISRLHSNGVLNSAEYASQCSALNSTLTELRRKRKRIISENEEDKQLDELRILYETLEEYEPYSTFDDDLFIATVRSIIVDSSQIVKFKLIGGLELPETIQTKGRCTV